MNTFFFFWELPGSVAQEKENTEYMAKKLIEVYQKLEINVNILKNTNRLLLSGIQNKKMQDCIDTKGFMALR